MTRLTLDEIIDATSARVVLTRDADGAVRQAAFDLTGLPRVESLLVGRSAPEVPGIVERLCGICPAAHHLAGIRALEALLGVVAVPPAAVAARRVLHHAAVVWIHATGLIAADPTLALTLRRFAKAAMAMVGSPGHFPATAVPGGVRAPLDDAAFETWRALFKPAIDGALEHARAVAGTGRPDVFAGADVALVDAAGRVDLFGTHLRAVAADGRAVIDAATPPDWDRFVAEADPGASAPHPYLVPLGPGAGAYRVGPVAQLRVGELTTPLARSLQADWRARQGDAAWARAIMTVHAIEAIPAALACEEAYGGPITVPVPAAVPAGVGVGWVDGARGLLVHRYATAGDGTITAATILTPTAQNEPWLGDLLRAGATASGADPGAARAALEAAIHEADPCLPCSAAPAGAMDLVVDTVTTQATEGD